MDDGVADFVLCRFVVSLRARLSLLHMTCQ